MYLVQINPRFPNCLGTAPPFNFQLRDALGPIMNSSSGSLCHMALLAPARHSVPRAAPHSRYDPKRRWWRPAVCSRGSFSEVAQCLVKCTSKVDIETLLSSQTMSNNSVMQAMSHALLAFDVSRLETLEFSPKCSKQIAPFRTWLYLRCYQCHEWQRWWSLISLP